MSAKRKTASERKDIPVSIRVTREAAAELEKLAAVHGFSDNRSKYIELAARGLLTVDRSKAGLD